MTNHSVPSTTSRSGSRSAKVRASLGQLILRTHRRGSHGSPRNTLAILKAQQEASVDGIPVVDHDGTVLSYNTRFLEIWEIPLASAESATNHEMLRHAAQRVVEFEPFIELIRHVHDHPETGRTDDQVTLRDGRTLARTSVPVVVASGRITGRAWYFRDITDARRSEVLQSALFRIAQLRRETSD